MDIKLVIDFLLNNIWQIIAVIFGLIAIYQRYQIVTMRQEQHKLDIKIKKSKICEDEQCVLNCFFEKTDEPSSRDFIISNESNNNAFNVDIKPSNGYPFCEFEMRKLPIESLPAKQRRKFKLILTLGGTPSSYKFMLNWKDIKNNSHEQEFTVDL